MQNPPMPFFAAVETGAPPCPELGGSQRGSDASLLPANVDLLSLEAWNSTTVLVRLQHLYEQGEHDGMSKSASVDVDALLLRLVGAKPARLQARALSVVHAAVPGSGCALDGVIATLSPLGICTLLAGMR